MVFLVVLFLLAILFGSVSITPDDLSSTELSRRAKRSQKFHYRLRRQEVLPSLVIIVRLFSWLFLVLLFVTATVAYGWGGGLLLSLLALALYPWLTRLSPLSSLSTQLYGKIETRLISIAEKTPLLWKFFYGRFFEGFDRERVFSSRDELADSIAVATDILADDERKLLLSTLQFRDKKVKSVMTPRGVIQTVKADEFIGPLVLDELHVLGHGRLPVIDGDIDHVVGVLNLRALLSLDVKKSDTAELLMEPKVFYIHQDDSLKKALDKFIKERHHLFIVVNDQRETVGLVTLEDVIEALIGRRIVDEDDVHDDMRHAADEKGKQNNNGPNGVYL